ncbi:BTAD domain-containing putative transcriptional regulator [Microbispora rosea]|uniref:AfsR/SARP family transcriptional regulator n=1 Tax=Microbispora rosea TaxID=58117 RepID=UPI0004C2E5EF|nr:BTAD domain-containing putative transcriptional regulator [Microbispora rosea]
MDFRLLGPVEVWDVDGQVALGRRAERCLLGLLLLDTGRVIPVGRLLDLLWEGEPPDNARGVLQSHVARLRGTLDPDRTGGRGFRLLRRGDGYLAETDPGAVDVHRFREGVGRGQRTSDPEERARLLREALSYWRGPLLADVANERMRDRVGVGLEELRLSALESCLEAELDCGRHRELLPELADLVLRHPDRERPIRAYMVALYRDGRPPEALAVYRRARAHFSRELGLEPTAELRRLHQMILAGDASLHARTPDPARTAVARPRPPVPAQLPPDLPHFVGRTAEVARLDAVLAGAASMTVCCLSGTAGVGKTTLAVHWAHRVWDRFPDGQLYVNLRGFDPDAAPVDPFDALRRFLGALNTPPERIPQDSDALVGLYRSLLAGRRVLVVLDNARDAEQVRPLLPGGARCLVLVTSRDPLTGLVAAEGAQPLTIGLLSPGEAREMLAARLGAPRLAAEGEAADDLVALCARLPLALAVLAARAATEPDLPLADLVARVRGAGAELDPFGGEDRATDVRGVFSWSYRTLGAPAARLFRLLALHPGPDVSTRAAAALAGLPHGRAGDLLTELARAHLVTENLPGRFALHDLLRAYARELADRDSADEGRAAPLRLLDHYLHTAHVAAMVINPRPDPLGLAPPAPGAAPQEHPDYDHAMTWFAEERPVLQAMVPWSVAKGFPAHAWRLAWTMVDFLDRRGFWDEWAKAETVALDAARRTGDLAGQALCHRDLASAYTQMQMFEAAEANLRAALALFTDLQDVRGQAGCYNNLGWLYGVQDRYQEALENAEQALHLVRLIDDTVEEARALNSVGQSHALLDHPEHAILYCREALTLFERAGDLHGQAAALDGLGLGYQKLADHAEAASCYERAVGLFRKAGERYFEADTLSKLGDVLRAAGDDRGARLIWRQALDILSELEHPDRALLQERLAGPGV